jgi:hypothetical protein
MAHQLVIIFCNSVFITVPDVEAGCCLGSEESGVSVGEGGEGGPSPPEGGKDKQSVPNKGRDNMGKDEEDQPSWRL